MITLKQGDCLFLMADIPTETVDLVVTSPPYDNLRTYNDTLSWSFDKFQNIAKELFRVVKKGGVVVWIVSDQTVNGSETGSSFRQALYFIECGFNLHDTMIWKKDSLQAPTPSRYHNCFEYMFVFTKGKIKTHNMICDRPNKYAGTTIHGTDRYANGKTIVKSGCKKREVKNFGYRFNIWECPTEKKNKTGHPAVFPLRLVKDHIISWSNEGDTVLDPFMGSGTTGIACADLNRNFIGFEIVDDYFKIAEERVTSAFDSQQLSFNL